MSERLPQEEKETEEREDDIEEISTGPEGAQETTVGERKREREPQESGSHRRPVHLDMLYREAEVIAHNLKESGTRR